MQLHMINQKVYRKVHTNSATNPSATSRDKYPTLLPGGCKLIQPDTHIENL